MLSLVVLGIGETKTRSSFKIVLVKVDLPTFGLPIIQNVKLSFFVALSCLVVFIFLIISSNKSPVPILCSAEM